MSMQDASTVGLWPGDPFRKMYKEYSFIAAGSLIVEQWVLIAALL